MDKPDVGCENKELRMPLEFQLSNTKNVAANSGDENDLGINNGAQF